MDSSNSSIFLQVIVSIFFFISSQRCSIGLRSGLGDCHGPTLIFFCSNQAFVLLAVWHGAPSCWKMNPLPNTFSHPILVCDKWVSHPLLHVIDQVLPSKYQLHWLPCSPRLRFYLSMLCCRDKTVWMIPFTLSSPHPCPPTGDEL